MSLIYVSNLLEHLVALWDVRGAPGSRSLGPIVNRWFLLRRLRDNPLRYHVNLFEIVHLVKFSGRRGSFARKRPGFLLGHVLRIGLSQLKPLEFDQPQVPRAVISRGPSYGGVPLPCFGGVLQREYGALARA